MSSSTAIEWTDATWNPWMGCDQVSPGCAHCYMFREQRMYGNDPALVRRSKTKFTDPLKWREPRRVFTCSWSDFFHPAADMWRPEAWDIIRQTPHLTYQILTKRPAGVLDRLPPDWGDGWPHVWLGVSVENQRWANERIPLLVQIPAAVRFLSCEPLLGRIDFWEAGSRGGEDGDPFAFSALSGTDGVDPPIPGIDWVIAGGESGPRHRPMNIAWARSLRHQCVTAGVPFFLKQLGGWPDKRGGDAALLDGKRWAQMPTRGGA